MTRCKFKCISKTISGDGENRSNRFEFTPVTDGTPEDKQFWKWTPSGRLEFSCLNPNVDFEIGKTYYLDLTLSE